MLCVHVCVGLGPARQTVLSTLKRPQAPSPHGCPVPPPSLGSKAAAAGPSGLAQPRAKGRESSPGVVYPGDRERDPLPEARGPPASVHVNDTVEECPEQNVGGEAIKETIRPDGARAGEKVVRPGANAKVEKDLQGGSRAERGGPM